VSAKKINTVTTWVKTVGEKRSTAIGYPWILLCDGLFHDSFLCENMSGSQILVPIIAPAKLEKV
jgi:hypothetical protein